MNLRKHKRRTEVTGRTIALLAVANVLLALSWVYLVWSNW